jgi:hypothetical protein
MCGVTELGLFLCNTAVGYGAGSEHNNQQCREANQEIRKQPEYTNEYAEEKFTAYRQATQAQQSTRSTKGVSAPSHPQLSWRATVLKSCTRNPDNCKSHLELLQSALPGPCHKIGRGKGEGRGSVTDHMQRDV